MRPKRFAMAPEALQGEYSPSSDCWSMGVIIFMLLSAQIPFYAKRSKNVATQIMRGKFDMSGDVWDNISHGAKHLVANLLLVDPTKRYTAQQALEHIWIRKWIERSDEGPSEDMIEAVTDSLQSYRHTSTLKKVALNVSLGFDISFCSLYLRCSSLSN